MAKAKGLDLMAVERAENIKGTIQRPEFVHLNAIPRKHGDRTDVTFTLLEELVSIRTIIAGEVRS